MKCELCKAEPATRLACMLYDTWKWTGYCRPGKELYYIPLDQLKNQKDATRWYHHLREKVWFGPVSQSSFLTKLDDLQRRLSEQIVAP